MSVCANIILRFIFDINVLTLSSFYRVYRISAIKNIRKSYNEIITEKGFICMVEILVKAVDTGASVIEVPMKLNFDKRVGKSEMKVLKTLKEYMIFLIRFSYRKRRNVDVSSR